MSNFRRKKAKKGSNPLFPETSQRNIFSTVRDMIEWFRMGGEHVLKSLFPQYGHPNTENHKTTWPFAQALFLSIFLGQFLAVGVKIHNLVNRTGVDQTFFLRKVLIKSYKKHSYHFFISPISFPASKIETSRAQDSL